MPTKVMKMKIEPKPQRKKNGNPQKKRNVQRPFPNKFRRGKNINRKKVESEEDYKLPEEVREIENTVPLEIRAQLYMIIKDIPNIRKDPLKYVFEDYELRQKDDTLWLEFGVATGGTINYISNFTNGIVYGFDSFEGLPEDWKSDYLKGAFNRNGCLPPVNQNVQLIKGWFNESLPIFLKEHPNQKISFIHIDCDLYSSTKCIFDLVWDKLEKDCVWVFDELVNYPGFDNQKGELLAFYELIRDYDVKYTWIGLNGSPFVMGEHDVQNAAVIIHSIERI